MANLKQSKKRAKQDIKKRTVNKRNISIVRTSIKRFLKLIKSSDFLSATKLYPNVVSKIDKSVSKGVLHKNKAARLKSSLNKKICR